mgnify:CR=1 FL=1
MKLVIQRVKNAQVIADGELSGSIGPGLLVLVGIHKDDVPENTQWFVNKLVNLRIFTDEGGKLNRCVKDITGEILIVSQFTLYANCMNGRRPDFIEAATGDLAINIYSKFVREVESEMGRVQTGRFGAYMEVSLCNDGPITIVLEGKP